jgi:hypothetical protein
MLDIYPSLYIGNQNDYEFDVKSKSGWSVVHACKDPYHRQAVGYSGRSVSKDHPEYLIARRGNRLILNLIDPEDPAYIPKVIIDAAVEFVHEQLAAGQKVLVHCNQGMSRSPSIGLLYLTKYTDRIPTASFAEAEIAFRKIYPVYNPAGGVRGFMIMNWNNYAPQK